MEAEALCQETWRCRCGHEVVVYSHASAVEHRCKTGKYEKLTRED